MNGLPLKDAFWKIFQQTLLLRKRQIYACNKSRIPMCIKGYMMTTHLLMIITVVEEVLTFQKSTKGEHT